MAKRRVTRQSKSDSEKNKMGKKSGKSKRIPSFHPELHNSTKPFSSTGSKPLFFLPPQDSVLVVSPKFWRTNTEHSETVQEKGVEAISGAVVEVFSVSLTLRFFSLTLSVEASNSMILPQKKYGLNWTFDLSFSGGRSQVRDIFVYSMASAQICGLAMLAVCHYIKRRKRRENMKIVQENDGETSHPRT